MRYHIIAKPLSPQPFSSSQLQGYYCGLRRALQRLLAGGFTWRGWEWYQASEVDMDVEDPWFPNS